jgi:transcription antitermination factor NusG
MMTVGYEDISGGSAMPCGKGHWYVLRSYPRRESEIFLYLEEHHYQVFLPIVETSFYRLHRLIKQQRPLISGYVFVKDNGISSEKLRFIPGSCGLLQHCEKPVFVCDDDIDRMSLLCKLSPVPELISSLERGQRIRICGGILEGIEGEIIKIKGKTGVVLHCGIPGYSFFIDAEKEKVEIL